MNDKNIQANYIIDNYTYNTKQFSLSFSAQNICLDINYKPMLGVGLDRISLYCGLLNQPRMIRVSDECGALAE
jgi:hypothetical protein